MNENEYIFVIFDMYCKICKHKLKPESEEPCDECLKNPTNLYSHKPVNFDGVGK